MNRAKKYLHLTHVVDMIPASKDENGKKIPLKLNAEKMRRNAPCPCGSGKKHKNCHPSYGKKIASNE